MTATKELQKVPAAKIEQTAEQFLKDQALMEEMLQQLADYRKRNEKLEAEVDRLNKEALENSITFENIKLKLETSNMHLDKMLEEKEHEFDRLHYFESYEICRDYLDGAIYMDKFFNRKSNRIEAAQKWYDSQPVLQK